MTLPPEELPKVARAAYERLSGEGAQEWTSLDDAEKNEWRERAETFYELLRAWR